MRLTILVLALVFLFTITGYSASPPTFAGENEGIRLFYYPESIEVFDTHISVQMRLDYKDHGNRAKYGLYTIQLRPEEKVARYVAQNLYDQSDRDITHEHTISNKWLRLQPPYSDLLDKVLDHCRRTGLTLPAYPGPEFVFSAFKAGGESSYFINFSTIRVTDDYVSYQIRTENVQLYQGEKYQIFTLQFKPVENVGRIVSPTSYDARGKELVTESGDPVWQQVIRGSILDNMNQSVLEYCRKNNISLP